MSTNVQHAENMEIKEKQIRLQTPHLHFVETRYINLRGEEALWHSVERPPGVRAVVIVAQVDDKLLVTKEFRVAIGDYEWSFPAGLIDAGESPAQAAARELREETGLELSEVLHISPFVYNSAGLTNERVALVFCRATGTFDEKQREASEEITAFLYRPAQVAELLETPGLCFSDKAWIILQFFAKGMKLW